MAAVFGTRSHILKRNRLARGRGLQPESIQNRYFDFRPEGPTDNRPGRKAGIELLMCMSAEGAARNDISECRAFSAYCLVHLYPGLTAGPIICRAFGPQNKTANLDKPGLQPARPALRPDPHVYSLFKDSANPIDDFVSRPTRRNLYSHINPGG
jgi:hypothetical protein